MFLKTVISKIKIYLGTDDEDKIGSSGNFSSRYTPKTDSNKYEMKVPERILVVGECYFCPDCFTYLNNKIKCKLLYILFTGQDQHVGMKAPPHELVLENSILSMNNFPPIRVRVLIFNYLTSVPF